MNYHSPSASQQNLLIQKGRWFPSLPAVIQTQLLDAGRERRLAAGSSLFRQGDMPSGLHGILKGQLHVSGMSRTGHEFLMAIHRPGDWVGFLTCIDRLPHPLSGHAASDLTVLTISPATITEIFETDVSTFRLLLQPEMHVGRSNYHWLVEMLVRPSMQRVAARLLQLSRWVHGDSQPSVRSIEFVSQEELASACTLSRQTMNNALRDLEARGFISVGYARIDIVDGEALRTFSMTDPKEFSQM